MTTLMFGLEIWSTTAATLLFPAVTDRGYKTCSWICKTKDDRPSHCVNNDNSCCCCSYDVTYNTKAGRRSCCPLRASCASVARAASNAEMFYAGLLSAYPRSPWKDIANHIRGGNPRIATVFKSQRGVCKRSPGQSGRQIKGTNTSDKRTAASFISTTRCHVLRPSKGPPIFLLALQYSLRHWTSRKSNFRPVVGDSSQGYSSR